MAWIRRPRPFKSFGFAPSIISTFQSFFRSVTNQIFGILRAAAWCQTQDFKNIIIKKFLTLKTFVYIFEFAEKMRKTIFSLPVDYLSEFGDFSAAHQATLL